MNRYLTISIIVLLNLFAITNNSYACDGPPTADISSSDPGTVCAGVSILFDGSDSHDNDGEPELEDYIDYWYWEVYEVIGGHEYEYDSFEGESASYTFEEPGEYIVYLWVVDDEGTESWNIDWCEVTTVGVEKIVKTGTSDSGPLYVVAGDSVSFIAIPDRSGVSFPSGEPSWYIESYPSGGSGCSLTNYYGSATTLYSIDVPGTYVVRAECGNGSGDNISVTAFDVEITNLQTTPYLIGSGNVVVSYTISPSGFTADSAVLEVRDKDGTLVYSNSSISKTGGPHTATWSGSSTSLKSVHWNKDPYEVKITIAKGSASCYDTTSMTVIQSAAVVFPEDSPTTQDPVTECMEGREVTFTGTAYSFVLPVTFTFFFQHANGTNWSTVQVSSSLEKDYTLTIEDVPSTPPASTNHNYDTPVHITAQDGYGHFATSTTKWIKVWELWIEYFRDASTNKAWKVCIGDFIEYSGISAPYCTNWNWRVPDGLWYYQTGGQEKQDDDLLIHPEYRYGEVENSDFGDTWGSVYVICEDEEGNNHLFNSTDMNPSNKAEIFFDPLKNASGGTTLSDENPPCWFIYWNQVGGVGDSGARYRHDMTDKLGAYWASEYIGSYAHVQIGRYAYTTSITQSGNKTHTGIHCMGVTVLHESTHRTQYDETHLYGVSISDEDYDWVKNSYETLGDLNLNGTLNTEDTNANGTLDLGEDVGLIRKELTLDEFDDGDPVRQITYGNNNGIIDSESGSVYTTNPPYHGEKSKYHADTYGGSYDDGDDKCYEAEESYTTNGYNDQDWSKGGAQW